MAGSKSGGSEAATVALRIITMALSAASAAVMFSSASQSTVCGSCGPASGASAPTSNIAYSDYSSLTYSLIANVISAALQAAAACLTVRGKKKEGGALKSLAELIDIAAQVFLASSAALSFSVDDFGSCGRRIRFDVCKADKNFCNKVHASGALSAAAAIVLAVSLYIKDVPVSISFRETEPEPGCGHGSHCHH